MEIGLEDWKFIDTNLKWHVAQNFIELLGKFRIDFTDAHEYTYVK